MARKRLVLYQGSVWKLTDKQLNILVASGMTPSQGCLGAAIALDGKDRQEQGRLVAGIEDESRKTAIKRKIEKLEAKLNEGR